MQSPLSNKGKCPPDFSLTCFSSLQCVGALLNPTGIDGNSIAPGREDPACKLQAPTYTGVNTFTFPVDDITNIGTQLGDTELRCTGAAAPRRTRGEVTLDGPKQDMINTLQSVPSAAAHDYRHQPQGQETLSKNSLSSSTPMVDVTLAPKEIGMLCHESLNVSPLVDITLAPSILASSELAATAPEERETQGHDSARIDTNSPTKQGEMLPNFPFTSFGHVGCLGAPLNSIELHLSQNGYGMSGLVLKAPNEIGMLCREPLHIAPP